MYFLLILIVTLFASFANSQTLLTDDIQYPPINSIAGINGWEMNYAPTPANTIPVVGSTLIYIGYPGSFLGNCILIKSSMPTGVIVNKKFNQTNNNSGSIYMACMLRVDTLMPAAVEDFLVVFDRAGSSQNFRSRLLLKRYSSSQFMMGVQKYQTANFSPNIFNTKTTYLVVMKYKFVPGGTSNDTASVVVLQSGIPQQEPLASVSSSTGLDADSVGEIQVNNHAFTQHEGLKGSQIRLDGFRVATTWLNAVLTGVNQTSTEVPVSYLLEQNYPNPFNPVTNINFSMVKSGNAKLTVFDVTGKEIEVLINENLSAGSYTADFDASKLTSGVYFYRLEANDFVQTKKMMLVK